MSATLSMIWFITTAVILLLLLGLGSAISSGAITLPRKRKTPASGRSLPATPDRSPNEQSRRSA
ncbi:hypothetical protein [Nocardioides sp. Root190]|uniref:hypothetical protein n=1 Tax=Nocardioides sp. Root190 TaxID=1736488 RepID=UPI000B044E4B|nr:hypothetical protein [Nocardioides sp. Root190]